MLDSEVYIQPDIQIYLQPVPADVIDSYQSSQLGACIDIHTEKNFPDLTNTKLAIVGVCEGRKSVGNENSAHAPNKIREYLFKLFKNSNHLKIADLGNVEQGFEVKDTYYALSKIVTELVKKNIIPIIIGGGQDLTYANYTAYQNLEQTVNLVSIDPLFDMGMIDQPIDSNSYLGSIILHQPNYLFNYSNIGYQTYLTDSASIDLMNKLYFDTYRLGMFKHNMEEIEPIVRNADMMSFDVSSIRMSDAPGCGNAGPNGFYGEEACQIMRYAGLSDKLSSIGIYEYNPEFDVRGQTAQLIAQMIWCFMDGYVSRKDDFPVAPKKDFAKYHVLVDDNEKYEIIFYKSPKSDRWWMEVPYPTTKNARFERHYLVPCSYRDYQFALNNGMPDRWWQTFQKLS